MDELLAERAVLADRLIEASDPRGELMAAQIALAQAGIECREDLVDAKVDDAELFRLLGIQRRVDQLVKQHAAGWIGELGVPPGVELGFRRGFPEAVALGNGFGSSVADTLAERLRAGPIGELSLSHLWVRPEDLPPLPGLRAFQLRSGGASAPAITTAILAHARPTRLGLTWLRIDDAMLDEILAHPNANAVRYLDLSGNHRLSPRTIARVFERLPGVIVTLQSAGLDDAWLAGFLDEDPKPRGLDVSGNPMTIEAIRALGTLSQLRHLGFGPGYDRRLDPTAVGHAIAKVTAPLVRLVLNRAIDNVGLAALAKSPHAKRLRALELDDKLLDATGRRALSRFPVLVDRD